MPVYHARSTKIRLSTAPSLDTTRFNGSQDSIVEPMLRSKSATTCTSTESFIQAAKDTLVETPILDPMTADRMRFLGQHKDMPFYIVRATTEWIPVNEGVKSLVDDECRGRVGRTRSRRPIDLQEIKSLAGHKHGKGARSELETSKRSLISSNGLLQSRDDLNSNTTLAEQTETLNHSGDRALGVTITLSMASFIPDPLVCTIPRPERSTDLLILVYLNGQLADESPVSGHATIAEMQSNRKDLHMIGTQVGHSIEKPWVLRSDSNGNTPWSQCSKGIERWDSISKRIKDESIALDLEGHGAKSVRADYLASLAEIPCPATVVGLGAFGCLDVVIIYGRLAVHDISSRVFDRKISTHEDDPEGEKHLTSAANRMSHSLDNASSAKRQDIGGRRTRSGSSAQPGMKLKDHNQSELATEESARGSSRQQDQKAPSSVKVEPSKGKDRKDVTTNDIAGHASSDLSSAPTEDDTSSVPVPLSRIELNAKIDAILAQTNFDEVLDLSDAGTKTIIFRSSPTDVPGPLATYPRKRKAKDTPDTLPDQTPQHDFGESKTKNRKASSRKPTFFASPPKTRSSSQRLHPLTGKTADVTSPPLPPSTGQPTSSGSSKRLAIATADNSPQPKSKRLKIHPPASPAAKPDPLAPAPTQNLPTRSAAWFASYPRTGPRRAQRLQSAAAPTTPSHNDPAGMEAHNLGHDTRKNLPVRQRASEQPEPTSPPATVNQDVTVPGIRATHVDDFVPDDLSVDAAIGYADRGVLRDTHPRFEGSFREIGVVMACRYII